MKVNEDLTRQVADLARIELSDVEIKTFTPQIEKILKYVELLQEVDVSQVKPMVHPFEGTHSTPFREDIIQPSPVDEKGVPKVLNSAPEVLTGGFKVPPIL